MTEPLQKTNIFKMEERKTRAQTAQTAQTLSIISVGRQNGVTRIRSLFSYLDKISLK